MVVTANPELMTDQEYIESDPSWKKELMESKNAPRGDFFEWDWRESKQRTIWNFNT